MSDPTEPSEPTSDPQSIEDELDALLAGESDGSDR